MRKRGLMPIDKTAWTDETVLAWGAHKWLKLKDVPNTYLLWLSQQRWIGDWPGLNAYLHSTSVLARLEEARKSESQTKPSDTLSTFEDYLKDYRGF